MKIFSFDNYWGLDWLKYNGGLHTCTKRNFIYVVDATRAKAPVFKIYKENLEEENLLASELDSDSFIMQLKSIKETGKILIK